MSDPARQVATRDQVLTIGTLTDTQYLKVSGSTIISAAIAGGGDALVANPLSQFAATTSLQLKNTMSDETGSGALVFADTPTLITPILGTPTSGSLVNCTGLPVVRVASWQGYTLPADTVKNAAYTYQVLANTLGSSKAIRLKFILRKTAGVNNVTIGAEWNGSVMHTAVTVTTLNYEVEVVLYGAGTTTAQRSIATTQTYTTGTVTRTNTVTLYAHDQTANLNLILYVTKAVGADVVILDYAEVLELET